VLCTIVWLEIICVCCVNFTQDQNKRSQLWRRNAEGRLVHIASSEARGHDMVLDISRETISSSQCEVLVVRKRSSSRNVTQTWHFKSVSCIVDWSVYDLKVLLKTF